MYSQMFSMQLLCLAMLVPTHFFSVTFLTCLGALLTKLRSLIGPQYRWGSRLKWWYSSTLSPLTVEKSCRLSSCFPERVTRPNSLPWSDFCVIVQHCWAACSSWFSCHLFTVSRLAVLYYRSTLPSPVLWPGVWWSNGLGSVAAALSKAGFREDVDCSPGSCISEYTDGWGAEEQQFSAVQCCGWEQVIFFFANIDFSFLVFKEI